MHNTTNRFLVQISGNTTMADMILVFLMMLPSLVLQELRLDSLSKIKQRIK